MATTATNRRAKGLSFTFLPDGHIRAYDALTPDKRGISECQIYLPYRTAPTIKSCVPPLLIITDNAVINAIRKGTAR